MKIASPKLPEQLQPLTDEEAETLLTAEERATIHGNDEHIRTETAKKAAEFYIRLMRMC